MAAEDTLRGWPWMLLAAGLVCLMPTNQSLWIDESTTALYSRTPTLSAFLEKIMVEVNSDAQMPLGNFCFRMASEVVGTSEVGLRSISALWILIGSLTLWRVGIRIGVPFLPVLFACHAFAWHYGGEVRPYAMQIGLSAGLVYALVMVNTSDGEGRGFNALLLSGPLLCATSMLAVVPVGVVTAVLTSSLARRSWSPRMWHWVMIPLAGVLTTLIGAYYVWTLALGKGAQTVGTWGVGFKNLALAVYELLGFMGFGPGRFELRELGLSGDFHALISSFVRLSALGAIVLALLYLLVGGRLLRIIRTEDRAHSQLGVLVCLVIIASAGSLFVLSAIVDFPFWGRHLAPLLPFVITAIALGFGPHGADNGQKTALPLALCVTLLCSSLILRFSPQHVRDDYRTAARIARAALSRGETVWWSASIPPALYYRVPVCNSSRGPHGSECVIDAVNLDEELLDALPSPDVILVSKPDLHDRAGLVRGFIRRNQLVLSREMAAFRVFENHPTRADE